MTRLRSLLLRWLLIPTLALWLLASAIGYLRSLAQAHEAYDRTLLGSALMIGERLGIEEGQVVADLPYTALEMLRTDAHDRIFYRVARLVDGGHITGYEDLPPPATPPRSEPVFYDATYKGQNIRVVALAWTMVDEPLPRALIVQVAETMDARRQLTRRMVSESAAMQLLLILAAAGLIAFGVRRGLAPLKRLRGEVRARGANDLTPIDTRSVPREVAPLIHAINAHTERQRQLGEAQVRFVANASHQLKTPLTLLRAQIDHALQQPDLDGMRAVVGAMHLSAHSTQRLVDQLLSLARSEPGRTLDIQEVDLTEIAREQAFDLLGLARAKAIDLGFEGEQPVPVRGEPVLLRELIANLAHNAVHYTPRGGKVTVRVDLQDQRPRLSVLDNGPGIPADERARVFERFYRGAATGGQGTGLGLAIVKEICDRHGIEIEIVDGAAGAGLHIQLLWPMHAAER
ncbi:MAG TPA: sensor histidine kinase N-terminal domain-containing protein [Ramlibacter sp.]|nr:sensor histidine kinase N-terminal domain-containing protein [Ramlibacter sp.]